MKWVSLKAIVLPILLGYAAPLLVFWACGWVSYWSKSEGLNSTVAFAAFLWFALIMPLIIGYLAAKHAVALPYYHALGVICLILAYMGVRGTANSKWMIAINVVTYIPLALVGARRAVRERAL